MKHRSVKEETIKSYDLCNKILSMISSRVDELTKLRREHETGYSKNETVELHHLMIEIQHEFLCSGHRNKLLELRSKV